jgi:hypothetical protein
MSYFLTIPNSAIFKYLEEWPGCKCGWRECPEFKRYEIVVNLVTKKSRYDTWVKKLRKAGNPAKNLAEIRMWDESNWEITLIEKCYYGNHKPYYDSVPEDESILFREERDYTCYSISSEKILVTYLIKNSGADISFHKEKDFVRFSIPSEKIRKTRVCRRISGREFTKLECVVKYLAENSQN